jgi:hypothetical protein
MDYRLPSVMLIENSAGRRTFSHISIPALLFVHHIIIRISYLPLLDSIGTIWSKQHYVRSRKKIAVMLQTTSFQCSF